MSDTPDYNRVIAECLVYPDKPSDELINVVQEVLTGNVTSREELQTLHRQLDKQRLLSLGRAEDRR
ncbi:hypothetical protein [Chloroflexus aggregans]|uniref:Uncharacterized protein n=1 Tax=Chloroflexus aggregans (strain MD-66 / DSM 9485) TaxID=326427 RepID=B8GAW3_CHLAD|nr:hypothetical protein [Chloroflexus aggregans]ACL24702.1 hypothetical protein Cagg_1803 [Chloroflexus aggregans DSM 9485]